MSRTLNLRSLLMGAVAAGVTAAAAPPGAAAAELAPLPVDSVGLLSSHFPSVPEMVIGLGLAAVAVMGWSPIVRRIPILTAHPEPVPVRIARDA